MAISYRSFGIPGLGYGRFSLNVGDNITGISGWNSVKTTSGLRSAGLESANRYIGVHQQIGSFFLVRGGGLQCRFLRAEMDRVELLVSLYRYFDGFCSFCEREDLSHDGIRRLSLWRLI